MSVIAGQAYRIRDMIGDVMAFARPPAPMRCDVDLVALARQTIAPLQSPLSESNCSVEMIAPESVRGFVDPTQFGIVVVELVRNSQQALQPHGGKIEVRLSETQQSSPQLEILDHGQGFSDLERKHAFDPFFSGRQAGRGLGFGLCKIWQIVRQHGGDIVIESSKPGPTCVRVTWPPDQVS
ncbi:MAG: hypothetical protein B7Z55_16775 [Planctomycetales bacterium 12-60-4]|nr:MAG: hypothetical protein B7Z55_16775 [Planctomycetales bacterium 12-60-4]